MYRPDGVNKRLVCGDSDSKRMEKDTTCHLKVTANVEAIERSSVINHMRFEDEAPHRAYVHGSKDTFVPMRPAPLS